MSRTIWSQSVRTASTKSPSAESAVLDIKRGFEVLLDNSPSPVKVPGDRTVRTQRHSHAVNFLVKAAALQVGSHLGGAGRRLSTAVGRRWRSTARGVCRSSRRKLCGGPMGNLIRLEPKGSPVSSRLKAKPNSRRAHWK
jgi:hypothetical protein